MGKYEFDGKKFNSIKEGQAHIRNILKTIGICKSVKNKDKNSFQRLIKILSRNVKSMKKGLVDEYGQIVCKDLQIKYNLKKDYQANIIKNDGTQEVISWTRCVNPSQKTYQQQLTQAMRYSIYPQIQDFKTANPQKKCEISSEHVDFSYHVDHIIPFKEIQNDFLQINTELKDVREFDDDMRTNMKKFKNTDHNYEKKFQDYHKEKAKLRWLCQSCNLKRQKCDLITKIFQFLLSIKFLYQLEQGSQNQNFQQKILFTVLIKSAAVFLLYSS